MAVTKMILCKGNGSPYLNCVGMKSETEFYISRSLFAYFPSELHTQVKGKIATVGKVPYCKDCIKKIFDLYYDGGKNSLESAVYYTCQKLDIPFIVELYEATMDIYRNEKNKADILNIHKTFIYKYIGNLNTNSNKYKEKLDFSYSDNTTLSQLSNTLQVREIEKKELGKLKISWGIQDCAEDYDFLQDRYKQYTEGVEFTNAFHPDLYRDLCRDRLILRKISEDRYKGAENITQVQNRVDSLSKKLKIDEFKSNKPKTVSELSLFEKIKMVDENNVNEVYKNPTIKLDLNQIMKYEEDLVLRPTLKTLINHRDYDLKLEDLEQYDIR